MAVAYNDPITFGRGGSAESLNCTGIDFSERGGRSWTVLPLVELDIQLPFARQEISMELEATPFLVDEVVQMQNVFIFLGGLFVGLCNLNGHMIRSFAVNRTAVTGRVARLALAIPTARSPKSLYLSEDLRELGIYLTSITFRTMS